MHTQGKKQKYSPKISQAFWCRQNRTNRTGTAEQVPVGEEARPGSRCVLSLENTNGGGGLGQVLVSFAFFGTLVA